MKHSVIVGVLSIIMLGLAASAQAAETIYEPFDYSAGALDGSQTNGIGMATNGWIQSDSGNGPYSILSGGLTFTDLPTSGEKCGRSTHQNAAQMNRPISAAAQADLLSDNTTIWFSVLVRNNPYSTGNEHQSIVLGTDAFTGWSSAPPGAPAGAEGFGVGYNGQFLLKAVSIDGGTSSYGSGSLTTVNDTTYLIVGKITWVPNGSNDSLWLFNISDATGPAPDDGDAFATASADLDQSLFDTLAVASKQKSFFDEIRFALTFAEAMGGTADATAPIYTALSPTNTATEVAVSSDLTITFDEDVKKGTGDVLIKEVVSDAVFEAIDVTSGSVTVSGTNVTINPVALLETGTNYYVLITNGVLLDLSDNAFAGITNSTMWRFTADATTDSTPPAHTALSPVDDASAVAVDADLMITFTEDVKAGSGDIQIKETIGDAVFATINVSALTFTDTNATINPVSNLDYDTGYYVLITNGVIEDLVGNPFAGITNSTMWNFATVADAVVPSPSPMTFAVSPAVSGADSIAMTATTATDNTPPIQYFFTNTINGDVSGWVSDTAWTNAGLSAGTVYGYQVKARDALSNETDWATTENAFIVDPLLYVYEGFQYEAVGDDLDGQPNDPGGTDIDATGLTGTWADPSGGVDMKMQSGSLTFGDLPTSGYRADSASSSSQDRFNRLLTADATNAISGASEVWFSILIRATENNSVARAGFALVNQSLTSELIPSNVGGGLAGFGIGSDAASDFRAYGWDGTSIVTGTAELTTGVDTYLLVGHISFDTGTAGADEYTLYRHEVNGGVVDGTALTAIGATLEVNVDQGTLDTAAITRRRYQQYDELRIGPTLDSVLGIPDSAAPLATALSPTNNATDVSIVADLSMTFGEPVQAGSGDIHIRRVDGNSIFETIAIGSGNVTFSDGSNVTINPVSNLELGTNYWVDIASGVIEDLSGNAFAGITASAQWNFTTVAGGEAIPPEVAALGPANSATGVSRTTDLVMTFNEDVKAGTGDILIKALVGDATFETIAIGSGNVSITTSNVTVNPTGTLAYNTGYYVLVTNGVIDDLVGNVFAGITNSTQWRFTTLPDADAPMPDPMTFAVSPAPLDAQSIVMTASTASDVTAPITYLFTNTITGTISGWQTSPGWTNSGLQVGFAYSYRVKARDGLLNETDWSAAAASTITPIRDGGIQYAVSNWFSQGYGDEGFILFDAKPATVISANMGTSGSGADIEYTDLASGLRDGTKINIENETGTATNLQLKAWETGALGTDFDDTISFAMNDTPSALRVGVLAGAVLSGGSSDPALVRLTDGVNSYTQTINMVGAPQPDWYFFDVSGITAATVLTVECTRGSGSGSKKQNPFNGVVFALAPDFSAPSRVALTPTNNATQVLPFADLVVGFDESVQKGTGNILIKRVDGDTLFESIDVTSGNVTISGADVTINPVSDLEFGTNYYVLVTNGVIEDLSGNVFAGINGSTEWRFTTSTPDLVAPIHVALSPADDATDVSVSNDFVISFDENIQAGSGNILIRETVGDALVESIDVGAVTISGTNVTITPSSDLTFSTGVYILITNGVITDLSLTPSPELPSRLTGTSPRKRMPWHRNPMR